MLETASSEKCDNTTGAAFVNVCTAAVAVAVLLMFHLCIVDAADVAVPSDVAIAVAGFLNTVADADTLPSAAAALSMLPMFLLLLLLLLLLLYSTYFVPC